MRAEKFSNDSLILSTISNGLLYTIMYGGLHLFYM